ncbi:unnamed protein product [Mytilus coruscus]|uniref:Reverse transcriptase zinc-binding domain-containing protein n=1 Tax=Mytilus coruscus TaxID=42192 RepID=A0A6J8APU9_MYTCO|nr:unnamed protein product [Mytilus coruscus]
MKDLINIWLWVVTTLLNNEAKKMYNLSAVSWQKDKDVKQAAYKSTRNKWQRRWEISERSRDHYEKIPTTKHSIMYDFPTKRHFSIFAQLRTGYTELNYYKNRVGQTNAIESCNCGAPEMPHHFLLECPCYENEREDMLHQISKEVGVRNLNLATMLTRLDGENTEETKA